MFSFAHPLSSFCCCAIATPGSSESTWNLAYYSSTEFSDFSADLPMRLQSVLHSIYNRYNPSTLRLQLVYNCVRLLTISSEPLSNPPGNHCRTREV